MARQARKISKSGNYYIVLKGNGLYETNDDKERFKEILSEKLEGGKVYGISIDTDEIRMTVKEGTAGISMNMKSVTTVYARYFNRIHNREGKLFEGRFKSEPLETKKELDDFTASLSEKTVPIKKAAVKSAAPKSAPKKAAKPKAKAAEVKKDEPKSAPKKNLPSWLL